MMNKANKKTEDPIMNYLSICLDDPKLNVWHLAILTAILNLGYRQGEGLRVKVNRRSIMMLSHINTLPTYHKYFKELQNFGYIKYMPSYHPDSRSKVELIKKRLSRNMR